MGWMGGGVIKGVIKFMTPLMALFHCVVRLGSARIVTAQLVTLRLIKARFGSGRFIKARLGSVRFASPLQFRTALEWAGLLTCRYSCAASRHHCKRTTNKHTTKEHIDGWVSCF